ncbi:hypothetical protein COS31_01025 [Candidatus Roizmanbacteria bacterium CG02_land_8_20_14_3_00_36_15]|uniref:Uncharacterized protein n=1 Tax=Candidatus Roizmanbacteria bacterium CG10_big_fil_rev_8_21_14_0_10_36_26 TaxID=1974851 RepID=A0A2M8KLD8_9BACT|nr:MAG: hypothetical protein COS51_03965 [Candidatus Roizmanbacteria bacterium CG03_land_8_20_14_0_80_36_21]PIV38140.1 MAG: hypothetical protein COS31_01025 [Candidatus Roizmanbacteria bacterium CG02_land_8_20_14_3_00_36_15]PIY70311.1 MAG: hypothetical protein COY89_01830 [Candidatus Roizmanbacteria bacterium CG_4_10_14_0_8_um_filter_36_36]PJA53274.1 MAG: hypothetical protein CO166_02410 [Candidatus Roizmanbacteria bacterium CG_4_9_14_3_um_filter_36_11]PJE60737.1 MAG: hypothetical protein COU86
MNKTYSNPCPRCGTERITVKTWKEKIYGSVILNKKTACPNKECQKIVDRDNKKQQDKNDAMKLRSLQRAQNRKANRKAKKTAKHA